MTGLLSAYSQAQRNTKSLSNLRKKTISTKPDKVQIDSLSIIPKTFAIAGVPDSLYDLDFVNGRLQWKQKPPLDSVVVIYRVFPSRLNASINRLRYDSIMNNFIGKPYIPDYAGVNQQDNFFNFGNLNYNG